MIKTGPYPYIAHKITSIWKFYSDGFRHMTVGKKLWTIIIIQLILIVAVIKLLFFPDLLDSRYATDSERAAAVRQALIEKRI